MAVATVPLLLLEALLLAGAAACLALLALASWRAALGVREPQQGAAPPLPARTLCPMPAFPAQAEVRAALHRMARAGRGVAEALSAACAASPRPQALPATAGCFNLSCSTMGRARARVAGSARAGSRARARAGGRMHVRRAARRACEGARSACWRAARACARAEGARVRSARAGARSQAGLVALGVASPVPIFDSDPLGIVKFRSRVVMFAPALAPLGQSGGRQLWEISSGGRRGGQGGPQAQSGGSLWNLGQNRAHRTRISPGASGASSCRRSELRRSPP